MVTPDVWMTLGVVCASVHVFVVASFAQTVPVLSNLMIKHLLLSAME